MTPGHARLRTDTSCGRKGQHNHPRTARHQPPEHRAALTPMVGCAQELTEEALANAKAQYRAFLEGFVEPAPEEPPAVPRKSKRKRKKKSADAGK